MVRYSAGVSVRWEQKRAAESAYPGTRLHGGQFVYRDVCEGEQRLKHDISYKIECCSEKTMAYFGGRRRGLSRAILGVFLLFAIKHLHVHTD